MPNPLGIYGAVLPVFLVIGLGAVLRAIGILPREMDRGVLKLVVNVLIPCLILDKMAGNPLVGQLPVLGIAAGVGYGAVAGAIFVSLLVGKWTGMKTGAGLRSFALGNGVQNYGYIAIPIIVALFPESPALGVLFVHSLGVELAIWTVGIMVLTGNRRFSFRTMLSGPVVAIFTGLLLAWTNLDTKVPGPLAGTVEMLGFCAIPMALILVGVTIADMAAGTQWSLRVLLGGGVLRLVVLPWLYIIPAYLIRDSYAAIATVFVVQAAMPSGNFPIVLARHYGGQPDVPIQLVVATTVGSLISMPLWLGLGVSFL